MGFWNGYWLIPTPRDPYDPHWSLGTRSPKGIKIFLDKYHTIEDIMHIIEHEDLHKAIDRKRKTPPRNKRKQKAFLTDRMKADNQEHVAIKVLMLGRDTTGREFIRGNMNYICPICGLFKNEHNECQRTACSTQLKKTWHWVEDFYDKKEKQKIQETVQFL